MSPVDFGGDPTGRIDSTAGMNAVVCVNARDGQGALEWLLIQYVDAVCDDTALNKCIAICLNQSALSPNGLFPGSRSMPVCRVSVWVVCMHMSCDPVLLVRPADGCSVSRHTHTRRGSQSTDPLATARPYGTWAAAMLIWAAAST